MGIPAMGISTGAPFERAGFGGFLEDKRRKVVETGILTIENNANEVKEHKDISNSEFTNGIKSQKIENENLSEPREFSENRQSSPLQSFGIKTPSISIDNGIEISSRETSILKMLQRVLLMTNFRIIINLECQN